MKKLVILLAMLTLTSTFAGCGHRNKTNSEGNMVLFNTVYTADEGLALAKLADAVVTEDGVCTAGKPVMEDFYDRTQGGEAAKIIIASYYTLDKERMSEELYNEEKDKYPQLFFELIEFNGNEYRIRVRKSDEIEPETDRTYKYLMHFWGKMPSAALHGYYDRYVLVNDASITWDEIEHGILSSQSGDWVEHYTVFSDYSNTMPEQDVLNLYYKYCSADEGLEAAKKAGATVIVDDKVVSGSEAMRAFSEAAAGGRYARHVVAVYTSLEHGTGEESREELKDEYPMLYFCLLLFDGDDYIFGARKSDDGPDSPLDNDSGFDAYKCLLHFEEPVSKRFPYGADCWVLTDEPDLKWNDVFIRQVISYVPEHKRFRIVYMTYPEREG